MLLVSACLLAGCQSKQSVDLIVHNATIYTVDAAFSKAEAFAVKDGKFVAIGKSADILARYTAKQQLDAQGKFIYPGFADAHCHFYYYGLGLQEANLVGTSSFEEVLDKLKAHRQKYPNKPWIIGRGWDQNDWENKAFPSKEKLDELFPDTPVLLTRVDGHAALANQKALTMAQITPQTPISGGLIEQKNGKLTGILVDNAIKLVSQLIPPPTEADIEKALLDAQTNCFAVGLTHVADAGLDRNIIDKINDLHQKGKLQMRVYAMVSSTPNNITHFLQKGFIQTERLQVRSFKIYSDGALGSRGACLLAPYSDKPDETGFLLQSPKALDSLIGLMDAKGFQINTHCIGDSANRVILDIYGKYLKGKNDKRWRIEHAQVVESEDFKKFASFQVIPSVQPTHCTSDMYWAGDRLGKDRIKNAYAYKKLLDQAGIVALGSDFPVEHINPLYGFHSAVARQDAKGYPKEGFQMEDALSREATLRGMTIWAAQANFEEKNLGSIEVGKRADFVWLQEDLMQLAAEKIRDLPVQKTFVGGVAVFEKK